MAPLSEQVPQNFEKQVKTASGPASEVGQTFLYTPKICSPSKPLAQPQRLLTLSPGTRIPSLYCEHIPTHASYSPSVSSLLLCPSLLFFSIPLPPPSCPLPCLSALTPLCWCYDIREVAWESEWPENQPAADTAKGPKTTQAGFACSLLFGGGGRDECV